MFLLSIRPLGPIPFKQFRLLESFWNEVAEVVKNGKFGNIKVEAFPQEKIVQTDGINNPLVFTHQIKKSPNILGFEKNLVVQTGISGVDKNIDGNVETTFFPHPNKESIASMRSFRGEIRKFAIIGGIFDFRGKIFQLHVEDKVTYDLFEMKALCRQLQAHSRGTFSVLQKLGVSGIITIEK